MLKGLSVVLSVVIVVIAAVVFMNMRGPDLSRYLSLTQHHHE